MPASKFLIVDGLCYLPSPADLSYLRKARSAGVSAIHFTVAGVEDGPGEALARIGRWRRLIRENPRLAALVERADDARAAHRRGKVGVIFGWQNGLPVERDLDLLEAFHAAGLRIVQPAYQRQNALGAGCGERRDGGLSLAGRRLVQRCNELGVALDVSHCGPRTSADIVACSARPVFATHTGSRAFSRSVRAKSDELVRSVAAAGGCVGIVTYSSILTNDRIRRPSLDLFLRHLEHVLELAGEDHVSLGLDFTPGWTEAEYAAAAAAYPEIYRGVKFADKHVAGLGSVEDIPALVAGLKSRGFSRSVLVKILGGNFLRTFKSACG